MPTTIPASDLNLGNIDPALIDAILPHFPRGFTHANETRMSPVEARAYLIRWISAAETIEQVKREHHPNQVRNKARDVVEALLNASGA
jgi:hypothetical protein